MNPIIFIKLMVSIFILNTLISLGMKYIHLVFRTVSENELRAYFGKTWMYGFVISLNVFGMILIWFPTLFHDQFFSNPIPTLTFVVIASLVFATVGAISARQPSNSVIALRKIQNEIKRLNNKE